jgi:hypothetical protein
VRLTEQEKDSEDDTFFPYDPGARPRAADLDADGSHDILLIYTGGSEKPGIFRLVRLSS